jgi:Haemolysin-type calcium binding protein related domain/RTX calcium-binding nonapeptide repeat (4 copies)
MSMPPPIPTGGTGLDPDDFTLTPEDFEGRLNHLKDQFDTDEDGDVDRDDFDRYDKNKDGFIDKNDAGPDGIIWPDNEAPPLLSDFGGGGSDPTGGGGSAAFCSPPVSPLVIDLNGNGIELTALQGSTTYFDLDVDGFAQRTGWVAPTDGLLALDRNGNGRIDDNSELFGNATGATDGFQALAELDTNADGVVNASDAGFDDLRVWQDLDQNGISSGNELLTLAQVGIASISLGASQINETNNGHLVSHRSTVTFTSGTTGIIEDVHFQNDPSSAYALLPENFTYHPDAFKLPVLWGYGKIASTYVAFSLDAGLRVQAQALLTQLANGDIAGFRQDFEAFALAWAGVTGIAPNSRGAYIDGQHLEFLERVYGTAFVQLCGTNAGTNNPGPNSGAALEQTYDIFISQLAARFMAQSAYSHALLASSSLAEFFSNLTDHPLAGLLSLVSNYSTDNRSLKDDLSGVIRGLNKSIEDGQLSAADAALIVEMLRHEVATSAAAFKTAVSNGIVAAGIELASDFAILLNGAIGYGAVCGTEAADNLSAGGEVYIVGGSGNDTIQSTAGGSLIVGGTGDDVLSGGAGAERYFYSRGDGNDIITDYDFWRGADKLILADVNPAGIKVSRTGNDMVLTLANGEKITLVRQLDENLRHGIESFQFANGTVLTEAEMRNRMVSDMKAAGVVTGTENDETYVHRLGDGSYKVTDYDFWRGADRLVLADVNPAGITVSRTGNDMVLTLANGERITLARQLDENLRHGIESFQFANGTVLTEAEMRNRMVSDMKATGVVTGTENDETYVHRLGGGSYAVIDYDFWTGADRFVFADVASTDVLVRRLASDPNDVVLVLANGEKIRLENELLASNRFGVETMEFSDGVIWSRANLASAPIVADSLIFG